MLEYVFSLTLIFPYKDRIINYVFKQKNAVQGKPVFTQCRYNTNIYGHLVDGSPRTFYVNSLPETTI